MMIWHISCSLLCLVAVLLFRFRWEVKFLFLSLTLNELEKFASFIHIKLINHHPLHSLQTFAGKRRERTDFSFLFHSLCLSCFSPNSHLVIKSYQKINNSNNNSSNNKQSFVSEEEKVSVTESIGIQVFIQLNTPFSASISLILSLVSVSYFFLCLKQSIDL